MFLLLLLGGSWCQFDVLLVRFTQIVEVVSSCLVHLKVDNYHVDKNLHHVDQ